MCTSVSACQSRCKIEKGVITMLELHALISQLLQCARSTSLSCAHAPKPSSCLPSSAIAVCDASCPKARCHSLSCSKECHKIYILLCLYITQHANFQNFTFDKARKSWSCRSSFAAVLSSGQRVEAGSCKHLSSCLRLAICPALLAFTVNTVLLQSRMQVLSVASVLLLVRPVLVADASVSLIPQSYMSTDLHETCARELVV